MVRLFRPSAAAAAAAATVTKPSGGGAAAALQVPPPPAQQQQQQGGGAAAGAAAAVAQRPAATAQRAPPAAAARFRAVSYNILCDKYSSANSYAPPEHLEWGARWPRIRAELEAYDADLLMLQEVERPVLEGQLLPWLQESGRRRQQQQQQQQGKRRRRRRKGGGAAGGAAAGGGAGGAAAGGAGGDGDGAERSGFGVVFRPKPLTAGAVGPEEGVALFYRESAFTLLESTLLDFAALAPRVLPPGIGRDPLASRLVRAVARRVDGAAAALLRHERSGREVLAAAVHLFWDPAYPDVKLVQAAALCRGLADFLEAARGPQALQATPVVIGGDFNALPAKWAPDAFDRVAPGSVAVSGVYELLTRGLVGPGHQDHPSRRSCAYDWVGGGSGGGGGGSSGSSAAASQDEGDGGAAAAGGMAGPSPPPSPRASPIPRSQRELGACALDGHSFDAAGLRLRSMHVEARGAEPPLTTRTATFDGALDYIFVSEGHFSVAAALEMPYDDAGSSGGGNGGGGNGNGGGGNGNGGNGVRALRPSSVPAAAFPPAPNAEWGSDHLAIGADLDLLAPGGSGGG